MAAKAKKPPAKSKYPLHKTEIGGKPITVICKIAKDELKRIEGREKLDCAKISDVLDYVRDNIVIAANGDSFEFDDVKKADSSEVKKAIDNFKKIGEVCDTPVIMEYIAQNAPKKKDGTLHLRRIQRVCTLNYVSSVYSYYEISAQNVGPDFIEVEFRERELITSIRHHEAVEDSIKHASTIDEPKTTNAILKVIKSNKL